MPLLDVHLSLLQVIIKLLAFAPVLIDSLFFHHVLANLPGVPLEPSDQKQTWQEPFDVLEFRRSDNERNRGHKTIGLIAILLISDILQGLIFLCVLKSVVSLKGALIQQWGNIDVDSKHHFFLDEIKVALV